MRQSSVAVITAPVTPSIGMRRTRILVSSDAPACVNEENNSPFVPMAMERNVAAVSSTMFLFAVISHWPECKAKLNSGVPLGWANRRQRGTEACVFGRGEIEECAESEFLRGAKIKQHAGRPSSRRGSRPARRRGIGQIDDAAVTGVWPPMLMTLVMQAIFGGTGRTITLNLQVVTPPQLFVVVHVTAFVPSGKMLPEGGEQTTGPMLPSQ